MYTTSSQTIGPYLHIGMDWLVNPDFAAPGVAGERISVTGRVIDGDGNPVNDAMLEIWQANSRGRYAHPEDARELPLDEGFSGWGRVTTDDSGRFRFNTIKPGRVPAADGGQQAPHLNVTIFMRGMLKQLVTRMYFDGDPANTHDPVLASVPPERRGTLIAKAADGGAHEWNIVLQGRGETVFFLV
jgi:protocatechuate 3,4-dioxygenase, alpha subunit